MSGAGIPWRRIDPRSIVVGAVPQVAWTWLTVMLLRSSVPFEEWFVREYLHPAGAVISVAVVLHHVVRWVTTFYAVQERTLRLRSGWLLRRRTAVDRRRVRSVMLRSGALARLLGLTQVFLGTGESGRDASMVFAWLPTAVAHRLRAELLEHARPVMAGSGVLARGRARWALWAPFTALSLSIWAGTYALLYQLFVGWFGWVRTLRWALTEQVDLLALARVLVLVPVGVAIVGAVLVYFEYWWEFRLERTPRGTLEVHHGLIVRRSLSLQESRLRGVEVVQPLVPRFLRRARLLAVSTGTGAQETLARGLPAARRRTLLPLAPADHAARAASAVLGREVNLTDLTGHPVQARYKRYRWAGVYTGLLLLATWVFFREPVQARLDAFAVAGLLVLAITLIVADDNYRALGHRLESDVLLLRHGTVRRATSVLQRRTVIGWVFRQSWFQHRLGLVTVIAPTAAGQGAYWLHDVGCTGAVTLARDITPELIEAHLAVDKPADPAEKQDPGGAGRGE